MVELIRNLEVMRRNSVADWRSSLTATAPYSSASGIYAIMANVALSVIAWFLAVVWLHWVAGFQMTHNLVISTSFIVVCLTCGLVTAPLVLRLEPSSASPSSEPGRLYESDRRSDLWHPHSSSARTISKKTLDLRIQSRATARATGVATTIISTPSASSSLSSNTLA